MRGTAAAPGSREIGERLGTRPGRDEHGPLMRAPGDEWRQGGSDLALGILINDSLTRIAAHPITRLAELLPHNWKPPTPEPST